MTNDSEGTVEYDLWQWMRWANSGVDEGSGARDPDNPECGTGCQLFNKILELETPVDPN